MNAASKSAVTNTNRFEGMRLFSMLAMGVLKQKMAKVKIWRP